MGFKLFTSTEFTVAPNEEVELIEPIKLRKERRGVVHGVVMKDCEPADDCLVKLFKKECDKFIGVGFTFTDCFGQFLFPICDTKACYVIKAFCLDEKRKCIKLENACPMRDDCKDCDPCDDKHEED